MTTVSGSDSDGKLQAVKGMNDILPPDSARWGRFERQAREVFERHGFHEVITPILEYTPLFVRSIGEVTDVVEKEMYTFTDRDERSVTMRPEGTASAVRAYLEHSVARREPVTRWYYSGPMFRHEKAQRGRYRQFYQMGVEALGVAEPTVDAEQIAMLHELFTSLGIAGLEIVINNVGGPADRPAYRQALVEYFTPVRAQLCPDCQRRLEKNPLRVLDCKVETCHALAVKAPSILDSLGEATRAHFAAVRGALDALEIPHLVDPHLVRGLDYYTGTIFEIRARGGDLGAQNTIAGGGRYDKLVEELGGPATPAFGFALGMERVVLSMPASAESFAVRPAVFVACLGDEARREGLRMARRLRQRGHVVEFEHRASSFKSQLKRADKLAARLALILGGDELARGVAILRDLGKSEQIEIPQAELEAKVDELLARPAAQVTGSS
jgi:histidyl-tRNA synthetase